MRKPLVLVLSMLVLLQPGRAEASHSLSVTTQGQATRLSSTQVEVRGTLTCHGAAEEGSIGVVLLQPPSDVAQDGGGSTAFVCAAGETVFWAVLVTANPGSTFEIGPARFSTFAYSQCADVEVDCPSNANDANLDIGRPSGPAGVEIAPTQLRFGAQPFGSLTRRTFILTNRSSRTLNVTIDSKVMPDDFSPGQPESTCPLAGITVSLLLPGQSCSHTVAFQPDPSFDQPESALMSIVSKDLTGKVVQDRLLRLSGRGVHRAS